MDRHKKKFITPTVKKALFKCLLLSVYATLPWLKERSDLDTLSDFSVTSNAAMAFVLGIVLVFLLNKAYERWWEARKHLGTLVNISRNLIIKVFSAKSIHLENKQKILELVQSFPLVLKKHLAPSKPGFQPETHQPNRIVFSIYELLNSAKRKNELSDLYFLQIDTDLRQFMDVCGSCERIRNTRMPSSIRVTTFYLVWMYLLFLPWGIVDLFPDIVFGATLVFSFIVLAVYEVSVALSDPFTGSYDALDLDKINTAIKVSTDETRDYYDSTVGPN